MAKMRVHEIAKKWGVENKAMVSKLQAWGYDVKSHSSSLESDQAKAVNERMEAENRPSGPPRPAAGVVIRRSKARGETLGVAGAEATPVAAPEVTPVAAPEPEAVPELVAQAESVVSAPVPEIPEVSEAPVLVAETPAPEAVPAPVEAGAPAEAPAPLPSPTRNQAVVVSRPAPGVTVRPRAGSSPMRPGVSGTATTVRTAPTAPAPAAASTGGASGEQAVQPDEEIRMIAGVPHVVKKVEPGRPTANQAVVLSRPVYIQRQFAPSRPKESIPMAPGIRPGSLVRDVREVQVINEGGRARDLIDVKKGRRPTGVRNEKVGAYSKQDLIDLVRARTYIPVAGRKKRATKKGKKTEVTEMKSSKKVISMEDAITVRELSERMGVKATLLIRKLMQSVPRAPNLNQPVDYETASLIAADYGWEVQRRTFEISDFVPQVEDRPEDMKARPPVVTVMGHVDHGKTSLLDALRSAKVAAGEKGGITQHIGAYSVTLPGKGDVTFLDTPGHEAFSAMRSRGTQITDLVILVVAVDDGVQPQTLESIKLAKGGEVPIVVAINKIDKPGANTDPVKSALANAGLQPEDWGGDVPMIPVSAREGTNLDLLLENVLLQAEMMELAANPKKPGSGAIIEARLERGRGPVATALVQEGRLKSGDVVVAGTCWGRVRTMTDDKGRVVKEATPGYPVQVVGLSGAPGAGDEFHVVPDEAAARKIVDHRIQKEREAELATSARRTVEDLLKQNAADAPKELVLIVKADVQGSAEAVTDSLNALSGKKVRVNVIARGVGAVNESDVHQAKSSKAMIVGFNVKPDVNAQAAASQENVAVRSYGVIYELLDDVKLSMENLLDPILREKPLGKAEVRQVFHVSKVGTIAGCLVTEGKVTRNAQVRVTRDRKVLHTGKLSSLKRFKDDVREVVAGTECGIGIEGFDALEANDLLDIFEIETLRPKLE